MPDSADLPDWAVEHARTALKIGMAVPEVEERLVAKGLSPTDANAIVTSVLKERLREDGPPLQEDEPWQPVPLVLSVAAGGTCLFLAYWFGGGLSAAKTLLGVMPALACIWFPELTNRSANPERAAATRAFGWLILFLVAAYRIYLLLIW